MQALFWGLVYAQAHAEHTLAHTLIQPQILVSIVRIQTGELHPDI